MGRGTARRIVEQAVRSFKENDLLSYASAMAFQALFALIPATLTGIALLGYLDLESVWEQEIAPQVRQSVQVDAYSVIDRLVGSVLGERRGTWLTFGIAFTLWQVSGAVRATMAPLNAMYHDEEERPLWKRFAISLLLAPAIFLCIGFAFLAVQLGNNAANQFDGAVRWLMLVGRWPLAALALAVSLWLLLRFAPAERHSSWTSLGALFVLFAWLLTSLGFALYANYIASYGSIFGGLASVIVLMTYIYLSTAAFLLGAQLDACFREQAVARGDSGEGEDEAPGDAGDGRGKRGRVAGQEASKVR